MSSEGSQILDGRFQDICMSFDFHSDGVLLPVICDHFRFLLRRGQVICKSDNRSLSCDGKHESLFYTFGHLVQTHLWV